MTKHGFDPARRGDYSAFIRELIHKADGAAGVDDASAALVIAVFREVKQARGRAIAEMLFVRAPRAAMRSELAFRVVHAVASDASGSETEEPAGETPRPRGRTERTTSTRR